MLLMFAVHTSTAAVVSVRFGGGKKIAMLLVLMIMIVLCFNSLTLRYILGSAHKGWLHYTLARCPIHGCRLWWFVK